MLRKLLFDYYVSSAKYYPCKMPCLLKHTSSQIMLNTKRMLAFLGFGFVWSSWTLFSHGTESFL